MLLEYTTYLINQ